MKTGRPSFETIINNPGSSFSVKHFNKPSKETAGAFWHMHPELELVYVSGGNGKRHVGNHLSYFSGGELIFMGSNLPHSGFSDRLYNKQTETVVQFHPEFLGETFFNCPENKAIRELFTLAKQGITFSKQTRHELADAIEGLLTLSPFDRLQSLLDILFHLAKAKDMTILNAEVVTMSIEKQDNDRIQVIFSHVKQNFDRQIPLSEMAALVNLTEPSFSRYFKSSTGKTFTDFVNEYRLVHASKLLAEGDITISQVALDSGFHNYSHFNKLFQQQFGQSASEYRNNYMELVS